MGQKNTFSTIFMLVMVFIIGSFVISLLLVFYGLQLNYSFLLQSLFG